MSVKNLCEAIKCVLVCSIPADSPGLGSKGRERGYEKRKRGKQRKKGKREWERAQVRELLCPGAG